MANNLEMASISKRFGGIRALSDVTFPPTAVRCMPCW